MSINGIIGTDRQASAAQQRIDAISETLSSENILADLTTGLPFVMIEGVRRTLLAEREDLRRHLSAIDDAKNGNPESLVELSAGDIGEKLIAARVIRGLTQKDLARKLGKKPQEIQRWESEGYSKITLSNFKKISVLLGVKISSDIIWPDPNPMEFLPPTDPKKLKKIIKHARDHGWFKPEPNLNSESEREHVYFQLSQLIMEDNGRARTPSLLRTGLRVTEASDDLTLLAWKAHVTRQAEAMIKAGVPDFDILNLAWLQTIPTLSVEEDGPLLAQELLLQHGIILIVEPQIAGMTVDGAAFLVGKNPVIALSLRRDAIDNFWFTLLHEIGHVHLHFKTGLDIGFFDEGGDEVELKSNDRVRKMEREADEFAQELLIPSEVWRGSSARISKREEPILRLAHRLKIHPAIIFGRIRMERKNYALFAKKIGNGMVRKHFFESKKIRSKVV